MKKRNTSWGEVAEWYDSLLECSKDTYQEKVIYPNILRLMNIKKEESVLDLACGQGYFSRQFHKMGGQVTGVDISSKLIEIAKNKSSKEIKYFVSPAEKISFLNKESFDKISIILAVQNIENINELFKECTRLLKEKGSLFIVMNHPCFRIPKSSSWGWDIKNNIQYRRNDLYMSEKKEKIEMYPGKKDGKFLLSFHRPLQFYFKFLEKNGFYVNRIEEWISHKISEKGPHKEAEDKARKEFPLFLFLEAIKKSHKTSCAISLCVND